jgi:hypothetical protein
MQLPLNALRAFEASARHLSFTRGVLDQFEGGQYREVLTVAVVSTFAVGRLTPLRAAYFFGSAPASNWRMAALKRSTSSLGTAIESW